MDKFLDILSNLYLLVYAYAYFALLDWLDPKGNFERIFKRPMQFWHCVVIFILWALVAAILPNLVNCIIGVSLLFLWIGYKLRS